MPFKGQTDMSCVESSYKVLLGLGKFPFHGILLSNKSEGAEKEE